MYQKAFRIFKQNPWQRLGLCGNLELQLGEEHDFEVRHGRMSLEDEPTLKGHNGSSKEPETSFDADPEGKKHSEIA